MGATYSELECVRLALDVGSPLNHITCDKSAKMLKVRLNESCVEKKPIAPIAK